METDSIDCYYQNFRGLRTKLREIKLNIIGTETWLHEGIYDSEVINLDRYNLFRADRNYGLTRKVMGSEVMIAAKRDYKVTIIRFGGYQNEIQKAESLYFINLFSSQFDRRNLSELL
ncbi:hypothetical protein JTB14_013193 [Gonioctena quinquepunctata]|nr:hypothetical protein JTB14_013193 [Gonioctena quinquepunctata]